MNKRIFAMLLALVMVVSMMSVVAFADDECWHVNMKGVDNHDGTHTLKCPDCPETRGTSAHTFVNGVCSWCDAECWHVDMKGVDNGDGTHTLKCPDCDVTRGTSEHTFVDGACTWCGAKEPVVEVCWHFNMKGVDNGDGTHTLKCPDCPETRGTSEHTFVDGVCTWCGAVCYHNGNNFEYVFNGDKDHRTHKTVCKDCGKTIFEGAECVVENNKCVGCGTVFASSLTPATPVEKCNHNGNNFEYVSNGDDTHNTVCKDCDTVIFEGAACFFEEGKCVACGAEKATCHHQNNNFKYVFDGDKEHKTHKTICMDCGATIAEGAECYLENNKCVACETVYATGLFPATPVKCYHNGNNYEYVNEGGHTHSTVCKDCGETIFTGASCYFEDGVCVACGASEKCYHAGNNYEYVSNGNDTHNTVCKDCGETIFKGADCYFENGVCVACGAKPVVHHMPWHPHHHHTTVNGVPQTGDEANMTLWIGIVVAASAVMAAAYVGLKKTR